MMLSVRAFATTADPTLLPQVDDIDGAPMV